MVKEKQTIEELQSLAKNEPDKALLTVKKIIKEYPYFMAARVLELDILKATNQKGYKHALRACALQTTQRNVLYQHLENLAQSVENDQHHITAINIPSTKISRVLICPSLTTLACRINSVCLFGIPTFYFHQNYTKNGFACNLIEIHQHSFINMA